MMFFIFYIQTQIKIIVWILLNFYFLTMIRHYTRPILLSSRLFTRQGTVLSINNFASLKSIKPLSTGFLLNKNIFRFAQLPKHKVLNMPSLSPTMSQGKIIKWNVKQGDQVNEGDVLCQVETDKATVGFQTTQKGVIAKILNSQGMISVGKPVAVLIKNVNQVSSFKDYKFTDAALSSQPFSTPKQQPKQQSPQPAQTQSKSNSTASVFPKYSVVKLPKVSPTMESGKIATWNIKVGDSFDVGDSLFSVETDKATVDYQATQKGFLAKIINTSSDQITLGTPVAIVTRKKQDLQKFKNFTVNDLQQGSSPSQNNPATSQAPRVQQNQQSHSSQTPSQPQSTTKSSGQRIIASPLAKTIANQKGINLSEVTGSGPDGRIIKQDVQNYQPRQQQPISQNILSTRGPQKIQPVTQQTPKSQTVKRPKKVQILQNPYEQIQLNSMRKTIAARLTQSKTTIPHYYVQVSVQMGKVIELRQQLNKNQQGVKISVNDIIVKAVALALRDVPDVNAQWHGTVIKKFKHADVSVAVATQGGLITPIVFRAETLGLLEIAKKTKDIAKRARQGKLQPAEFIGGTTTVSNLGMFGINSVTSVINPPQSTILGVGQTQKKVVFDANSTDQKSPYKVIDSMELIVSADHRVVDGALAAKWLSRVKKYLQDPVTMLL